MFTKPLAIRLNQPVTCPSSLPDILVNSSRVAGKSARGAIRQIAINAGILFDDNGKGEYLRFVQVTEARVRSTIICNRLICPNDCSGSFCEISGLSA
jgi:hypothetical protein